MTIESFDETYGPKNLPFIDLTPDGKVDFFALRPSGNFGCDNATGQAIARALVKEVREYKETHLLIWTSLALCDLYNRDFRGLAIGMFDELGQAIAGRGAKS